MNMATKGHTAKKTAELIDNEVRSMIDEAYQRTIDLLTEKKQEVEAVAQELLEKEIIFKDDIERLIGKRKYDDDIVEEDVQVAEESGEKLAETSSEEEVPADDITNQTEPSEDNIEIKSPEEED